MNKQTTTIIKDEPKEFNPTFKCPELGFVSVKACDFCALRARGKCPKNLKEV